MPDIGYARVSKRVQNLDLQLDALHRAGCQPIFADKLSGVRDDRPKLAEALVSLGPGDSLVVWRLDRLARSLQHLVQVVSDLQQRGVKFRSLTESIDTSGATGRLVFHVLAALAQFERELMIERVSAGLESARARGRVGGPPPYGLADDRMTIVAEEAALLLEAAGRVLDREPVSRVVDDWTERGETTRRGGRWTVTSLRSQLLNPRVIPILGQDTHDLLAALFGAPDRQRLGRPGQHLLSGILRCGFQHCQQPLYARRLKDRWVYRCEKRAGSGGRFNGCGQISISLPRADQVVTDMFIIAMCGEPLGRHIAAQLEELGAGGLGPEQLEREAEELAELGKVLETRFATAAHRARAAELEARALDAERRMREVPDLHALTALPTVEADLRVMWEGWTVHERRIWLRRVFNHVSVKPAPTGTHHRGSDIAARLEEDWKL